MGLLPVRPRSLWPLALGAAGALLTGCIELRSSLDHLRDAGPESHGPDSGRANADASTQADAGALNCLDPSGFGGLGCSRCAATDTVTLENACADVTCTPFDDAKRLPLLLPKGRLPELPAPENGTSNQTSMDAATPHPDAGVHHADAGEHHVPAEAGAEHETDGGTAVKQCAALAQQGTLVYVTGSSAAGPFLAQVAQQFSTEKVYLVYTSTGSCVGVDAIVNGTPMTTGPAPAPATSALYWSNPASAGEPCQLPAEGVIADLGISDVFAQTCPGFEYTSLDERYVRDSHGPIQTMAFVVPANSRQTEISAQAAYFVYGFGKAGGVLDDDGKTPIWNDELHILQRKPTSGTQAMLAAAIGVPPERWKGVPHGSSDDVLGDLRASENDAQLAAKTIGILAADYIDGKNLRAQVRMLAFRDSQQHCAVYPDSSDTARDRKNVRDGHYPLWGPMHLRYRLDEHGLPSNPGNRQQVGDVVSYLAGTKALPNAIKLLDLYAQTGLIPECAMRVTRSTDGGNITPLRPPSPCSCLFEARSPGGTQCKACKVQGDCPADTTCSQGYCEP
jgi:ABC-type phosphate transport system substrate-binding protein